MLLPLYLSLLVAYAALAALGWYFVVFIREHGGWAYVREQGIAWLVIAVLGLGGVAVYDGFLWE